MRKTRTLFTAKFFQVLSLGTLCAVGAFAMGIETAGDVHPFASSQAALQEIIAGAEGLRGDANGNGVIDADDAYLLYEVAENLTPAVPLLVQRGDTNGDQRITEADVGAVLRVLSQR